MRIVVLGYLIRCPLGGIAWSALQYVIGLRRLGHDVLFLEDSSDSEWCCFDPERNDTDASPTFGLRYAAKVFSRYGLADRWAYWDAHTKRWLGARAGDAEAFCRSADLLLNVCGINPLRDWAMAVPHRAFIDTDPPFNQLRHRTRRNPRAHAAAHNTFFSFGENIGRPDCSVPDDGFPWRPTRQPVVLDLWPVTPVPRDASFSTVMTWESYPSRRYRGVRYGAKSVSFAPYRRLPRATSVSLELALGGKNAPRQRLQKQGWRLADPLKVALYPWDFQSYVQSSAGEFGVAKHGYVVSWSGWFGERSAGYLASGRPVVIQDTGFSDNLPTGDGLCAFSSPDEALDTLRRVANDLPRYGRAARELAAQHFDSRSVLTRLIDEATTHSTPPKNLGARLRTGATATRKDRGLGRS